MRKSRGLTECVTCRFRWYTNPRPAVVAILSNKPGDVLLAKRAIAPSRGRWGMPGGFVDLDETAEEALQREIKEEVGITVNDFQYFGSYVNVYEYQKILYANIDFFYEATIINQLVSISDETTEYRFFSLDIIPFKDLSFQSTKKALHDYVARNNVARKH